MLMAYPKRGGGGTEKHGGEERVQTLLSSAKALADSYEDLNFTAQDLSRITAEH